MYQRMVEFLKNGRNDTLHRTKKIGATDAKTLEIIGLLYDNLNTAIVEHDPRLLSRALQDEARHWLDRKEAIDPLLNATITLEDALVQLVREAFADNEQHFRQAREIIIANLDMARSDTALLLERGDHSLTAEDTAAKSRPAAGPKAPATAL